MLLNSTWNEMDQIRPSLMQEVGINLNVSTDAIKITPVVRFLPIIDYTTWVGFAGTPGTLGDQTITFYYTIATPWSSFPSNVIGFTDINGMHHSWDVVTDGGFVDWQHAVLAPQPIDISAQVPGVSLGLADGTGSAPIITFILSEQYTLVVLPQCEWGSYTIDQPVIGGTPGVGIVNIQSLYYGHIHFNDPSSVIWPGDNAGSLGSAVNAACVFPVNSYLMQAFDKGLFTHLWWNNAIANKFDSGIACFTGYEISVEKYSSTVTTVPPSPSPWAEPAFSCPT